MKNILLIASDNSYKSGAFLCMVKLCELLKKDNHVLAILPNIGDGAPLLEDAGIEYIVINSRTWIYPQDASKSQIIDLILRNIKYNFLAVNKIRKIIKERSIDIVHINTIWSYVGALAALKEKTKLVWHIREQIQQQQQRNILFGNNGYGLINRANIILTVSNYIADSYAELNKEKISTVYDGLDEDIYYCKRSILNQDVVKILSVGLVAEQKGQEKIIRACAHLVEKGFSSFDLDVVGSGVPAYVEKLKELTQELGLDDKVHFCGPTHNTVEYYRKSDIFIMSSHSEAFGRTTVEAMMSGCVVLGANSGATPELLDNGRCGYMYEYDDIPNLSNTIFKVVCNKEQARAVAELGQTYAIDRFTAKRNAHEIEEIYKELK